MDIADKIAFACMFLSDDNVSLRCFKLQKHIHTLFLLAEKLFTQVEDYTV